VSECPGGCGREDVPPHLFACPSCLELLPMSLREHVTHRTPESIYAIARAKLFYENRSSGA
jgi:hypothetical protein